jgi:predicted GH43/DUF377 family glycosyl hydrolase
MRKSIFSRKIFILFIQIILFSLVISKNMKNSSINEEAFIKITLGQQEVRSYKAEIVTLFVPQKMKYSIDFNARICYVDKLEKWTKDCYSNWKDFGEWVKVKINYLGFNYR